MRKSRLILVLLAAIGSSSASYGVMFTMLDDFRKSFGVAESALGLIVATGFFTSFLGQVTLAPLADKGRAQRLMVFGLVLEVVGLVLMAISSTYVALLISRLIMGFGAGAALPALRRVIIVADPEHFGRNLGRVLSFEVGGFATGPVVSVLLIGQFGIPGPLIFLAVVIGALALVLSQVSIPETKLQDQPTERFAIDLLKNRNISAGIMLGIALFFMIGTFDSLWVLMMDDLGAKPWMANLGISVFALPLVLMGPFGGKLIQRVGPYRGGGLGILLGALFMVGYGVMPAPGLMLIVFLLHSVNDGFFVTGAGVAVGTSAPLERQAGAQGLLGGMETLAGGVAASFAGVSYDHFGRTTTFIASAAMMASLVIACRVLAGKNWSIRNVVPKSAIPLDII